MATVYLALGSNVGDSRRYIGQAVGLLGGVLQNLKQAPVYTSKAVGYTDQPDFLNTGVSGQTGLEPKALMNRLQEIEQQVGRTPTFRHGPREIDIDIIFYDDTVIETPELTIPHPDFRNRDFVLKPLSDIKGDLNDPLTHKTVTRLLEELSPSQRSILK